MQKKPLVQFYHEKTFLPACLPALGCEIRSTVLFKSRLGLTLVLALAMDAVAL